MRTFASILLLFGLSIGSATAQVRLISFAELKAEILREDQALVILNFWATWCKPCVEELPDLEKITTTYPAPRVKVILANLDFHSQVETAVVPFVTRKSLQSQIVHISDADPDTWINSADPRWSGALPATLIYYRGQQTWFREGKTDYRTLDSLILNTIQP